MTDQERAKLLQDDGFLARLRERVQRKLFNRWIAGGPDGNDLWYIGQAVDEALKEITAQANEWKRENRNNG